MYLWYTPMVHPVNPWPRAIAKLALLYNPIMGKEVSTYINAVVAELQAAYGDRWNIRARGESAEPVSGRPWGVQIGYSAFSPRYRGDAGLDLEMTCAATVYYAGVGATHNDGFQEADIAVSLLAWLSGHVVLGTLGHDYEVDVEPLTAMRGGVETPTGQYAAHLFWNVRLDDIDPDIDVEGYETSHPARPLAPAYYYEIELADGTRRVVTGAQAVPPPLPDNGVAVRDIVIADPLNVPATTDETRPNGTPGGKVYYPALAEIGA